MRAHTVGDSFSVGQHADRIQASWMDSAVKFDMDNDRPDSPRCKLATLLERTENSRCADCNEPDPTWASTNWGVFICTQCAGVHRSLGVEHSFVLSCKLDNWSEDQVTHMEECGNEKINAELEYCVPKTIEVPCLSYTDRDTREKYIHAKYVTQLFKKANGKTSRPPDRVVRKISPQGSPTTTRSRGNTAMVEYIGIVHVHVVECRNLIIKDILSSDPYCVLRLGTQVNKTKTKKKTLAPKYGEHFTFSWDGCDSLVVELFDKDDLTKDDHMGRLQLDLSPLLAKEGVAMRGWHLIRHRKKVDKLQGEILLEVSFMAIK